MFGRKKDDKIQTNAARQNAGQKQRPKGYGQMGLLDVPDISDLGDVDAEMDGDDDDDDELEAELMALQAGLDVRKVISRHRLEAERSNENKPKNGNEFGSDDDDEDVDENDPELLAELEGIHEEESRPSVKPAQPSVPIRPALKPRSTVVPPPTLPQMPPRPKETTVSELRDLSATVSSPPSSSSVGSVVDVLHERIQMYKAAQANAKEAGEAMKLRRLDRGLKTLESMLKSVKAGRPIAEEDIPPPVAVGTKPPVAANEVIPNSESQNSLRLLPATSVADSNAEKDSTSLSTSSAPPLPPRTTRPAPIPPPSQPPPSYPVSNQPDVQQSLPPTLSVEVQNTLKLLNTRKIQYRQAALNAKKENDKERTLEYVKIAKQFDMVIAAVESGQEVDLSNMPPPPQSGPSSVLNNPHVSPMQTMPTNVPSADLDPVQTEEPLDPSVFNAPLPPTSTNEALQQRLQKYQSAVDEANSTDNASKARRMGRIVKQYEDAIKAYKAGKQVDFDELPTPPGFAPIPINRGSANVLKPSHPPQPQTNSVSVINAQSKHVSDNVLSPTATIVPNQGGGSVVTPDRPQVPVRTGKSPSTSGSTKSMQRSPQALHEKQHAALVERQSMFKSAALDAKRRGDIQAAKEYLKLAKGFDPMIKASLCGLPVNMDSVPKLPQQSQESTFELVSHEDCEPIGDREELFEKLDKELIAQIEMCANNRSHFSKIGDIQSKKKFEKLLLDTKKDLDYVRHANKGGFSVPRFHYEMKTFSIVKCHTDLGDDDMELSIIKGINYACPNPKDVDTYIRYEFPYPPEAPQKDKTFTVRDSNNPEYNAVFKLNMSRKARTLTRVIKRQAIKLEVWSKGGFLRSDSLIGTAVVKLAPLETCCMIHDSFDLMDGRKPIGGKLEVQIRIRDPILNKEVETLCEKWLLVTGGHTTQI